MDVAWPLELTDGAQAVQIDTPDSAIIVEARRDGYFTFTPICCGPAAPLPDRWEFR
jgi:hypothetical protein